MLGTSCARGCFMKNFCFDTICNITQETQELYCLWVHRQVGVIKYHQLLSKVLKVLTGNRVTLRIISNSFPLYFPLTLCSFIA